MENKKFDIVKSARELIERGNKNGLRGFSKTMMGTHILNELEKKFFERQLENTKHDIR